MGSHRRLTAGLGVMALLFLAGCSSSQNHEAQVAETRPIQPGVEKTMIVILGASYAQGWTPGCDGPLAFVNRGAPGEQSFEMLARFESDVLAEKPAAVILWGYINDIFRTDEAGRPAAKARAREGFQEMIRLARAAGVKPILATEVTIRQKAGIKESVAGMIGSVLGKTSYQDRINGHVTELNDWLRALAETENLLLLDFEKTLSGPDGRRKKGYANEDGSHITAEGYEALTRYACEILDEHFREESEPRDR